MYTEIKPSIKLENLIESFWTYSNNTVAENFKLLPDNCADLIFDLNHGKAFVSGVMNSYQVKALEINSDLMGIRFKAENFRFLSRIPLIETKNLSINYS